ncbi:MAG TPA: glycosyltransferase [Bryobacteraceae bacterium]|nr:glycosyltransferase [Bryobacteraceae bacterium]
MTRDVQLAFASGSRQRNPAFLEAFSRLSPEVPLYVVSEFPCPEGKWIPYHPLRSFWENYRRCRFILRGRRVRLASVLLEPRMPYRRMVALAVLFGGSRLLVFNENLDHFRLHPRCFGAMLRHVFWRLREFLDREIHPGGATYTFLWRLRHPRAFGRPLAYQAALAAGGLARLLAWILPARRPVPPPEHCRSGLSVVLYGAEQHSLDERETDVRRNCGHACCEVIPIAALEGRALIGAVNRALERAAFDRLCLLPASVPPEPGFFRRLAEAFEMVPDLFCAAPGGLCFSPAALVEGRFKQRTPLAGESGSYVLGAAAGLWSTRKLLALGGLDEGYATLEFALLDAGFRAWRRGWPSVGLLSGTVPAAHSPEPLPGVRRDALRFLVTALGAPRKLWNAALSELNRLAAREEPPEFAMDLLRAATRAPLWIRSRSGGDPSGEAILGLTSGAVRVFAGRGRTGKPLLVLASPYPPFPLSHGGAVRMYNLMRCAAADYDLILVSFTSELAPPARELLEISTEVVFVLRTGSHSRPATSRPDAVEEFASPAFDAALRQAVRKWRPFAVQLEYTQMAQYARACHPARTILVEHDVTFDLYDQLCKLNAGFDVEREARKWRRFEQQAWRDVDCVVVMSERDRSLVRGARCWCLPNGVDLERFRPAQDPPEPRRLLFVGSFAHLPNLLAVEFFLKAVWPRLARWSPRLHIIAGPDHRRYLGYYRDRVELELDQPGVEVEGFVADVRPAYARASVVVAPLVASAGTNIKVLEALAMGRAVVSTPAGIHGLDLEAGREVLVAGDAGGLASAIATLFENEDVRRSLERAGRNAVESRYSWDRIAGRQRELYETLRAEPPRLTAPAASRRRRAEAPRASAPPDRLPAHSSRG